MPTADLLLLITLLLTFYSSSCHASSPDFSLLVDYRAATDFYYAYDFSFSPDGREIVATAKGGVSGLQRFDGLPPGDLLVGQGLPNSGFYWHGVDWSRGDGQYIGAIESGTGLAIIRVWNATSSTEVFSDTITGIDYAHDFVLDHEGPNPELMAGAYTDGSSGFVKIYNVQQGFSTNTTLMHTFITKQMAFSPNGARYLSMASDTLRVYDVTTETTHSSAPGSPFSTAWSPDGSKLFVTYFNRLDVFTAPGFTTPSETLNDPFSGEITTTRVATDHTGTYVAIGCDHCDRVRVYRYDSGSLVFANEIPSFVAATSEPGLYEIKFSPFGTVSNPILGVLYFDHLELYGSVVITSTPSLSPSGSPVDYK